MFALIIKTPSVDPWQIVSHSAAIVLLLSLWGDRRMQMRVDAQAVLADVNKCLEAIAACKPLLVFHCFHRHQY